MTANLKLIETTVAGPMVRMLYADKAPKEQAAQWVEIFVKSEGDDNRRLGVIQKDALQCVQTLLNAENNRLRCLADSLGQ